jgi:hypothetical protein
MQGASQGGPDGPWAAQKLEHHWSAPEQEPRLGSMGSIVLLQQTGQSEVTPRGAYPGGHPPG